MEYKPLFSYPQQIEFANANRVVTVNVCELLKVNMAKGVTKMVHLIEHVQVVPYVILRGLYHTYDE